MGTVARRGKKRKAPHLEPQGGEGNTDLISSLPNTILDEIISLLPTNDGARTQILARQWRHIWRSATINLDHSSLPASKETKVSLISRIIAEHKGPIHRFSVPALHLQDFREIVKTWLGSSALDNLQELKFDTESLHMPSPHPLLPPSTFRFAVTLRVATLSTCQIILNMSELPHFPQLRHLGLEGVLILKDSLHNMIIRCPILECLLLKKSYGFGSISINSNTLVSIGLDLQNVEIIIEDAPKLEKLLQLEPCIALRISVISASKLDTLGCLSACDHNSKLAIGTTVIQELHDVTFTAMVCSVKALSISIQNLGGVTLRIDTIINLMRFFPCLQKLYIQTSNVKGNWCHHEHPNVVRCLDISLKEIVLQNYQATESEINLATFFILNAKKLEIMKFQSRVRNRKKSITVQKQLLQLEKRASTGARFQFLIRKCDYHYPLHIKHVGDLSKADPFECIC